MPTRTFTPDQLEQIGVPSPYTAALDGHRAEHLFEEQIDTRRWVSVHHLVFRAPDDGKAWRVEYEQGLTETQDDHDPWNYKHEVEAVEVELRPTTVMEWHAIPDAPALSGIAAERPAAEIIREQRDNITFNRGDMVAALRDALLDPAQHTPATATAAAHVLLAAHTRHLAAVAREYAAQRNTEMRDARDRSRTAAVTGMNTVARLLTERATLLDPQSEHQAAEEQPAPPAPAYRFTQLAVPCPRCKAPIGQLCTSHNGTRVRRTDTHTARSDAYHAQEAGR